MSDRPQDRVPPADADATRGHPESPHPSRTVGPYRLLQLIGQGGMGEVWLAEQTQPVRRQVALKVIKAGMDTAQVVSRFEAERQALALMDHPAIATVFDAGSTPEGHPYFAMEYVKGEPITAYCDQQRLGMAERLALFVHVCEGVQHAHQKGVIHRDLKPSNVLVALQDGQPVPKIIDFGVAKATTQPLTERTLYTELGVMIGTPEYMSPEQARLTGLDVDTRTDVYALGVLLYELLTGALPFDRTALREKALEEIQRTIREVDPPKPSTRVTQMGPASTDAARNRHTEARRLASELRGDLDWITMKCLEKDRTRRYGSASDLAADIRRHLDSQPVVASPPGTIYRARKFARRHRFGVAATVTVGLLLAAFAVTMAVQAQRIARERDRANREAETAKAVSGFLVGLFQVSEPSEAAANSVTAREILDNGALGIRDDLETVPGVRAALMSTMGEVYRRLGLLGPALELQTEALDLRRRTFGERSGEAAASLVGVGDALVSSGRAAEAEPRLREALAIRRGIDGGGLGVADALESLGACLEDQARYDEAERLQREGLEIRRRVLGDGTAAVADSWTAIGGVLYARSDLAGAGQAFRRALAIQRALRKPGHPRLTYAQENLAVVLTAQGQYAEAEATYRDTVSALQTRLGPDHQSLAVSLNNLGAALQLQGKYEEAAAAYHQAVEIARKRLGAAHPSLARYLRNLGQTLDAAGRPADAEARLREALRIDRAALGADHPSAATDMTWLSSALRHAGALAEAESLAREAGLIDAKRLGPDHPRTIEAAGALGLALAARRRWAEAEPLLLSYHAALASRREIEGSKDEVARQLVELYAASGKPDKAAEWRAKLAAGTAPAPPK